MTTKIHTLSDLKEFLGTLTDEQLSRSVKVAEDERTPIEMWQVEILDCDMINPSGEGAEPITDYLEGGQFYAPDFDINEEVVVAKKGEIYFYADEAEKDLRTFKATKPPSLGSLDGG